MPRVLFALIVALLLVGAGLAAAGAQTSTPTPPPPDTYADLALVQLGYLRNVAGGMYQVTNIPAAAITGYVALLTDEIQPFASNVTPPAQFAPFHVRLFASLRPCLTAANIIQKMGKDTFAPLVAASYTQNCYAAVSDTSVEWARITGTAPIFATIAFTATAPAANMLTGLPTPTPAADASGSDQTD